MPSRNNSRADRLIINSVGEDAIWVCNSNGNIENGDYITSSDYLGYGEKQDDDILHNYTVAKATIDCNFELDLLAIPITPNTLLSFLFLDSSIIGKASSLVIPSLSYHYQ